MKLIFVRFSKHREDVWSCDILKEKQSQDKVNARKNDLHCEIAP